jgi:hypothetical protein
MKPKTKLQREVVGLSSELPKISRKQQKWAYDNMFEMNVVRLRKTLYCLECGHSWKDNARLATALIGNVCPSCKSSLKQTNSYKAGLKQLKYFAIVDTKNDFQVVRMFVVNKFSKKHVKPKLFTSEVMQHWITDKGKITSLVIGSNSMNGCYDAWSYDSKLEIRTQTYSHELRVAINPHRIYPEMSILPIFKRNGIKRSFHAIAPHTLCLLILKDQMAETLLKSGQFDLLRHYSSNIHSISTWRSVKICIRNKYKIKDVSMWLDYLDLLRYFKKDTHNPFYICPINLKKVHDKLMHKKEAIQEKQRLERDEREKAERLLRMKENQIKFEKRIKKFLDLQFCENELSVEVIKSIEDFKKEGEILHHCVFQNEYYSKDNSLILSARINDEPIETIEISLQNFSIVQARGKNNQITEYHDRIINLVESNTHKIAKIAKKLRKAV